MCAKPRCCPNETEDWLWHWEWDYGCNPVHPTAPPYWLLFRSIQPHVWLIHNQPENWVLVVHIQKGKVRVLLKSFKYTPLASHCIFKRGDMLKIGTTLMWLLQINDGFNYCIIWMSIGVSSGWSFLLTSEMQDSLTGVTSISVCWDTAFTMSFRETWMSVWGCGTVIEFAPPEQHHVQEECPMNSTIYLTGNNS